MPIERFTRSSAQTSPKGTLLVAVVLLVFCAFTVSAQQPGAEGSASLAGKVLNSVTGEPLSKAEIRLFGMRASQGEGPRVFNARSGADGTFALTGIAPGEYVLNVSRRAFASQAAEIKGLPAARRQGRGVTFSLQSGQQVKSVEVLLPPAAVITGQVVDEDGEPMAGVMIEAEQYRYIRGRKTLAAVGRDTTDDRGVYRIFDLPSGRYFVKAQGRSLRARFGAAMMGGGGIFAGGGARPGMMAALGEGSGYPETYYPNAINAQEGIPLQLAPGAEMGGIDFVLTPRPTYSISGVVSLASASAERGVVVSAIESASGADFGGSASMSPASPSTGEFTLRNLSPGTYDVVARANMRGRGPGGGGPNGGGGSMGATRVDLGTASVDGISIAMQEDVTIQGKVILPENFSTDRLARIAISPERRFTPGRGAARADQNGAFSITVSPADTTSFAVSGLPDGLYVKRIQLGSRNLLDGVSSGILEIAGALRIELSDDGALVTGYVRDPRGNPLEGARITLLPVREGAVREAWRKSITVAEDGSFQLAAIAPGKYRLYAFEELEQDPSFDPDFLSNFGQRWVELDLKAGESRIVEPVLIPAADTSLYLGEVQ